MATNIQKVKQFAVYVDKTKNGGNGNGYVDGDEVSVFQKKCKTAGIKDVDKILEDYNNNRVQYESEYDKNGTKSNSSIETAVISAFNSNSILRTNDKSNNTASTIKEGIKSYDKGFLASIVAWWNDDEELLDYSNMVDENNVLDVVDDNEVVSQIVDADDEVRESAGSQVVESLIQAAADRQIDVSNIVTEKDGKYVVGRDVAGAEFGSEITDEDNLANVISALKNAIKQGQYTVNGEDNNKEQMLNMWAKKIDSEEFGGNNNGYIDTPEEIAQLKQIASRYGYDIDTVLEEIRDNETNGVENTTKMQKTIFNIFDPEQRAAQEAEDASQSKDTSKALSDGLENDNQELVEWAISNVNSDNVMEILDKNPDAVDKLVEKYDYNWLRNLFGKEDDYQNYTNPILESLYEYAQENGIEVDDIVVKSGKGFMVGSKVNDVKVGSDATDADNVSAVVNALKDRIKSEQV